MHMNPQLYKLKELHFPLMKKFVILLYEAFGLTALL